MKKIKLNYLKISLLLLPFFALSACQNQPSFDAMGMFEANEIIVSAEANGEIKSFKISEGLSLDSGAVVGSIDCIQLELQKAQVLASMEALGLKQNEASPQVAILQQQVLTQQKQVAAQKEQLKVIERERQRFASLLAKKAVTQKQYDDLEGQSNILKKQIETSENQIRVFQQQIASQNSVVSIQNRGIMSEAKPLQVRLQQLEDQIRRCQITNPQKGTVISKYAENHEVTGVGKPLYKIADMSTVTLRAYISNEQLSQIKLNQAVKVKVDKGKNESKEYAGTLTWIADKAEFTPKSIQTKDERANLVYAIKVKVKNDGFLKIGMYGEIKL
ncbi:MAG: HlyD family efflux transporter periplasmic adaptor subunit [Microscillaceae bacterium]|jgi:HlyD family secretion protein|nr:HlyD family efflux transporter periplasmic adaptor subunit [Microscillaceae bacterium]